MRTPRVASIALIACTATLCGCGTPHYWTKPNATIEQFRTDNYACVKEATGDSWKPYAGYGRSINADLHLGLHASPRVRRPDAARRRTPILARRAVIAPKAASSQRVPPRASALSTATTLSRSTGFRK
jgi:hypothetical protein